MLNKISLHANYYLHHLGSCLDIFSKPRFEGCRLIAPAHNRGRAEDIPDYLAHRQGEAFRRFARNKGYVISNYTLDPFGNGVCLGASIVFAKTFLKRGLESAAQVGSGGANLEAVTLQAEYQSLERERITSLVDPLVDYLRNEKWQKMPPEQALSALAAQFDLKMNNATHTFFLALIKATNIYLRNRQSGEGFRTFMEKAIDGMRGVWQDDTYHELLGLGLATIRRVDTILRGGSVVKTFRTDVVQELCRSEEIMITANHSNRKEGAYLIFLPVYTSGGNTLLIVGSTLLLAGACFLLDQSWIAGAGFATTGILAIMGNWKWVRTREGKHAVVLTIEKGRASLHDPNTGTWVAEERGPLLKSLFRYYLNGVAADDIDIHRLENRRD